MQWACCSEGLSAMNMVDLGLSTPTDEPTAKPSRPPLYVCTISNIHRI